MSSVITSEGFLPAYAIQNRGSHDRILPNADMYALMQGDKVEVLPQRSVLNIDGSRPSGIRVDVLQPPIGDVFIDTVGLSQVPLKPVLANA